MDPGACRRDRCHRLVANVRRDMLPDQMAHRTWRVARANRTDPVRVEMARTLLAMRLLLLCSFVLIGGILMVVMWPAWGPYARAAMASLGDGALAGSRLTALCAYLLLWMAMLLGVLMARRPAFVWPSRRFLFQMHRNASLLALALALLHALLLVGVARTGHSIWTVLSPLAGTSYRPFWVGLLGKCGLYALAITLLGYGLRSRFGQRAWRRLHLLGIAVYPFVLAHGLAANPPDALEWAPICYWLTGITLLVFWLMIRLGRRPAGGSIVNILAK